MARRRSDGHPRFLIAGGGTAGHLIPGLVVADELVRRGHPHESIAFVGAERGPEVTLVPERGYALTALPGRGIARSASIENVAAAWGLLRAAARAPWIVRRLRPQVVLTLGGFASVACALSAALWRIPLVVADQNALAGSANKLVARFATATAAAFDGVDLPRAVLTGNPVRPEVVEAASTARSAARARLGLPADRTVVAVFSGSLGSRRINTALIGALGRLADRSDLAIYHVFGRRDWDARDSPEFAIPDLPADGLSYVSVAYSEDIPDLLAAADVGVTRAGGSTVAELSVVGLPAILVPLPIATRDHQRANAAGLVRAGGAVLVDDDDLTPDRLLSELLALIDVPGRLVEMAAAARTQGHPDAAARVADLVEAAAEGRT
ncbi:MAG: UDP-N-acetylglucosamine--N-acetylmuramyl-(pentapeptide) pyrophosphoryl-undecaprenol N-acetylglucosamine transferase [Microthrixaceae bacterium]